MNRLKYYCLKWQLSKPEQITRTFTSDLYRVVYKSEIAVLKILNEKGQKFEGPGATVLKCFKGVGVVHLLEADPGAHLLEFIEGPQLKVLVEQGKDELAMDGVCEVIQKIHSYSGPVPAELNSMEKNFRALFEIEKSTSNYDFLKRGADLARKLIATAIDLRVLHGDIHHENILYHSRRGWIAIDPQCLFGERTYDLANSFYNPSGFTDLAANPERIQRLADKFSHELGIDKLRILQFAFAYGCLSAAWKIEDGHSPETTIHVASEVERQLQGGGAAKHTFSKTVRNPDAHYLNAKLANLYDLDSGWSIEREFYLSLAGSSRKRVLDLGCGTGLICDSLAAQGHEVTGVDPAPAMLEVAKLKPNGNKIEWVESLAQHFRSEKCFDLIIMTGNAFQVLLDESDLQEVANVMAKHLAPGGLIAFETRNPNINWSRQWNYEVTLKTPSSNVIESRHFLSLFENRMKFELRYKFPDEILTSQSELRFWYPDEIIEHFKGAGLVVERIMGDWNGGEYNADSTEEMVFFVRRQT